MKYKSCENLFSFCGKDRYGYDQNWMACSLDDPEKDCPHDHRKCILSKPDKKTKEAWRKGFLTEDLVRIE